MAEMATSEPFKLKEYATIKDIMQLRLEVNLNDDACAKKLIETNPIYESCNVGSLRKKIGNVVKKVKLLKKNKTKNGPNHDEFMNEIFKPSISKLETEIDVLDEKRAEVARKVIHQTKTVVEENNNLKRKVLDIETYNADLQKELETMSIKLKDSFNILGRVADGYKQLVDNNSNNKTKIEQEANKINEKYVKASADVVRLTNQIQVAREKLSKFTPRNVTKKLKRRDDTIDKLKNEVEQLKDENENLWTEVINHAAEANENEMLTCSKIDKLTSERLNFQKRISKLKSKVIEIKQAKSFLINEKEEIVAKYDNDIAANKKEINELQKLVEISESDDIVTFENGKYTNEVRQCCMQLLSECNVSLTKLPAVITTVLKTLTGKVPLRLPSKTLLSWLMVEAKVVASRHVAQSMLENFDPLGDTGNVLHQDATTKFHSHYEGFQVTLKSGSSLSIGLKQVGGGDSATYFQAFLDTVDDLTRALSETKHNDADDINTREKLICSIKNYMSDQCATNGKLNESLDQIREKMMPSVIENYEKLTPIEKESILTTGKFSCRLHLLANFGLCCDKGLAIMEQTVCEGENPHSFRKDDSSGTFRLARTAAKALTRRGSDKAGVAAFWEVFLKGKGKKNEIVTFYGHRINIAFHDCAAVYYHRKDIKAFLSDLPDANQLLKSVLFDCNEKVLLAGCRAMGICDKLLTAPFWNILEQNGSILDLNGDLLQMKLCLEQWANDGSLPLTGEVVFDEKRVSIRKDHLYDELFADTEDPQLDTMTQLAIELICTEMLIVLERQAAAQLPGGKYWQPTEEVKKSSINVPKTNTISERDMVVIDNLIRIKPSASSLTMETQTMCMKNKPFQWLSDLDEQEKTEIINGARKLAPEFKKTFKERQERVFDQIKMKLEAKREKVEDKETKARSLNIKCTNELVKFGGLWAASEINEKLASYEDEKSKREALLCQIKFHKNVLRAKGSRQLFQEQHLSKKYSNNDFKENLLKILELNDSENTEDENSSKGFVYKEVEDMKQDIDLRKKELRVKLLQGRNRLSVKRCQNDLKDYLNEPEKLIDVNVKHKCINEEGVAEWFEAKVLSIKTKTKDPIKTEFNIRYKVESEEVWFFPLLCDLKKGDLITCD